MSISSGSKILANDVSGAIKSITRSGTTFTYTKLDGSTGTFTQQDNNTTYSAMTAATADAAGKAGLVPAPAKGAQTKFLRGDATWQTISTETATMLSGVAIVAKAHASDTATQSGGMTLSHSTDSDGDKYATVKLPSGGTWRWISTSPSVGYNKGGQNSGGTQIVNREYYFTVVAIRVA